MLLLLHSIKKYAKIIYTFGREVPRVDNELYEELKGTIDSVVYYNEGNDYAVLEIRLENELIITAVGTVPIPFEGECVILKGLPAFDIGKGADRHAFGEDLHGSRIAARKDGHKLLVGIGGHGKFHTTAEVAVTHDTDSDFGHTIWLHRKIDSRNTQN